MRHMNNDERSRAVGMLAAGVDLQIDTLFFDRFKNWKLVINEILDKTSFRMNMFIELCVMLILDGCNVQ